MTQIKSDKYKTSLGGLLTKFIYAALEDIDADAGITVDRLTKQTYENICRPKDKKLGGLKNRFTVTPDVKQMMLIILIEIVNELRRSDIKGTPTAYGDIAAAIPGSTLEMIYSTARCTPGPLLRESLDASNWIHTHITDLLTKFQRMPLVITMASQVYIDFLKTTAHRCAAIIWATEGSVTKQLFIGVLLSYGIRAKYVVELSSQIHAAAASAVPTPKVENADTPAVATSAGDVNNLASFAI